MLANFKLLKLIFAFGIILAYVSIIYGDEPKVTYNGAGWLQFGRVEESFTPPRQTNNNYTGTWQQNSGGVLGANVKIDDNWSGDLGLGVLNVHLSRGKISNANIWYPFWVPFISDASLTYTKLIIGDDAALKITMGAFPFNYNPDAKNMGLYLTKGYVYPGAIVSALTGPLGVNAAQIGAKIGFQMGRFKNDLLLLSESDDKPLYDISIVDAINLKVSDGFEIGTGVNFYRIIPQNSRITSPGKDCLASKELGIYNTGCFDIDSIGTDVNGATIFDTTTGSLAGTKLVGHFHLDTKKVFGFGGPFAENEMVLYGESAILGVKSVGKYYKDILQRIPVMVGFNFPTFRVLTNLSLEVEYYASKNSGNNLGAQFGSWVPTRDPSVNNARDDWKWSLNIDRMLGSNLKLSAQFANDHLRLGGFHNDATGVEVTTTPKDWYWTTKVVYFF